MVKQPKKRGRPPASGNKPMTQLAIRLTDQQLKAIDRVIAERRGVPDRTSVIRELITRGLETLK